ncbi:MAG TPA: hypothetical protein VE953_11985 [Terriglobales bacterium]|nr:hypothetical protein [Terriglobales bacterium]
MYQPGDQISSGTLHPDHLIPAFIGALPEAQRAPYQERWDAIGRGMDTWEAKDWLLEDLYDALNDLAPEGCYFGAHEGDGSDFGFWPIDADD